MVAGGVDVGRYGRRCRGMEAWCDVCVCCGWGGVREGGRAWYVCVCVLCVCADWDGVAGSVLVWLVTTP